MVEDLFPQMAATDLKIDTHVLSPQQVKDRSSKSEIVKFQVEITRLGTRRFAKGFKVPSGTEPQEVYQALLDSGLKPPSMIIYSAEGNPHQSLLDEFESGSLYSRWGDSLDEAASKYCERAARISSFVIDAAVKANAWLYSNAQEGATMYGDGCADLAKTRPSVLNQMTQVYVGDGYCYGQDHKAELPQYGWDLFRHVQDGGLVIYPALSWKELDTAGKTGFEACSCPAFWATHMVICEDPDTASACNAFFLTLCATARLRLRATYKCYQDQHADAVQSARRGELVLNIFNGSLNANHFAALLYEGMPTDIREYHRLQMLEDEASETLKAGNVVQSFLNTQHGAPFKDFFQSVQDRSSMLQSALVMFAERNLTWIGENGSISIHNGARDLKKEKVSEQAVQAVLSHLQNAAKPLPKDTPWDQFLTYDVRLVSGEEVTMSLVQQMTAAGQAADKMELGGQESEKATMTECWQIHDRMCSEAEYWRRTTFTIHFIVTFFSLGATATAIIYAELKSDSHKNKYHWLQLCSCVLPVLVSCFLSMQATFNPVMKWALCMHTAANAKSQIYTFRARVGQFSMMSKRQGGLSIRTILANAVSQMEAGIVQSEFANSAPPSIEEPLLNCFPKSGPTKSKFIDHPKDDGISTIGPDEYLSLRVEPLHEHLRSTAHSLAKKLTFLRFSVIIITFSSTVIGVYGFNQYIPMCVALGSAFQSWIDFQSLPSRLANVNQALSTLGGELRWFKSLDFVQRGTPANFGHIVETIEEQSFAEASAIVKGGAKKEKPKQEGGEKKNGDEEEGGENGEKSPSKQKKQ